MGDELTNKLDQHVGFSTEILRFFRFLHLPEQRQTFARPWAGLR